MTYVDMPIAQIDRNPDQPRKHFDPEALAELAASIKASGLIEPIVVRPAGDRYQIVAGERRWRAAQDAGLEVVPVRVMDLGEVEAYVLAVAENVNRADMNLMEEAEAFDTLLRYGKTKQEIADLYGKTKQYVEIRLSYLNLVDDAQTMVANGQIRGWLARFIAELNPANQRTMISKWARGEFAHEDEASYFARALRDAEQQDGFFELEEPTVEEREEHERRARKVQSDLDKMNRLAELLHEIAHADPDDLAAALGNDVHVRFSQVEAVATAARQAQTNMLRVKAAAVARSVVVRDEVVA